jgi:hypothetical protein
MYETIAISLSCGIIIGMSIAALIDYISYKKLIKSLKEINDTNKKKTIKFSNGTILEAWDSTLYPDKAFISIKDNKTGKEGSIYADCIITAYDKI